MATRTTHFRSITRWTRPFLSICTRDRSAFENRSTGRRWAFQSIYRFLAVLQAFWSIDELSFLLRWPFWSIYPIIFRIGSSDRFIDLLYTTQRFQSSSYRIRVRVSDGTWAVQTGAAIDILDVNDNAPIFEKDRYVFIVNKSQVSWNWSRDRAEVCTLLRPLHCDMNDCPLKKFLVNPQIVFFAHQLPSNHSFATTVTNINK